MQLTTEVQWAFTKGGTRTLMCFSNIVQITSSYLPSRSHSFSMNLPLFLFHKHRVCVHGPKPVSFHPDARAFVTSLLLADPCVKEAGTKKKQIWTSLFTMAMTSESKKEKFVHFVISFLVVCCASAHNEFQTQSTKMGVFPNARRSVNKSRVRRAHCTQYICLLISSYDTAIVMRSTKCGMQ